MMNIAKITWVTFRTRFVDVAVLFHVFRMEARMEKLHSAVTSYFYVCMLMYVCMIV